MIEKTGDRDAAEVRVCGSAWRDCGDAEVCLTQKGLARKRGLFSLLNSEKLRSFLLYLLCSEYQTGRIKMRGKAGWLKPMRTPLKGVKARSYERKD
jgi:hypothetical protein